MEEKDRLLQRILSLTTSAPWTENLRLNRESIRTLCEEGMLGGNPGDPLHIASAHLRGV